VDLKAQSLYWSDQTCRIHDCPPGHQPSLEAAIRYYHGPARQQIATAVEQAVRLGRPYDLELPLVTARGRSVWVTVGEAEYEDGRGVRLFGAFQDVTSRRALEASLELASTQLRHLYERTPALLLSLDSTGTVLTVSDQLLLTTGFLREQVVVRPLVALLGQEIESRRALPSLFETGRCERTPYQLKCADGGLRDVLMSAIVELGTDAESLRALAALEDVTETVARTEELRREHKMRLQIERNAEELNTLLTERSEMLDVLAHEVRQPLNNGSAALQSADAVLAQRGEGAAAEQLRRAQGVLHAVLAGVDNTLAVSSLLVGAAEVEFGDVDLDMLLGIVVADMPSQQRARVQVLRETSARTVWWMPDCFDWPCGTFWPMPWPIHPRTARSRSS
jgi:PAS domain-containing protein